MKKIKLLLVVSTLLFSITALCVCANAATYSGYCGGEGDGTNLTWTLDTTTGVLEISGEGKMRDYSEETPTDNFEGIFSDNVTEHINIASKVKKIEIVGAVTYVGKYSFMYCTSLECVTISNSVTVLGDEAFAGCSSLSQIELSHNLKFIGLRAFSGCSSLLKIEFPDSLEGIERYAFRGCSFMDVIKLPYGLKEIHSNSFEESTIIDGLIKVDGILFTENMKCLVEYPKTKTDASYSIPKSVKTIASEAFSHNNFLEEVILPEGLETICDFAFIGCYKIKNLIIPSTVYDISEYKVDHFHYVHAFSGMDLETLMILNKRINVIEISISGITTSTRTIYCYRDSETGKAYRENSDNLMYEFSHYLVNVIYIDEEECAFGDANFDGEVNIRDVTLMLQCIAGWEVDIDESAADVTGDGEITIRDVTLVLQQIAGWNVLG